MSEQKGSKVIHPDDSDGVPKQPGNVIAADAVKLNVKAKKGKIALPKFLKPGKSFFIILSLLIIVGVGGTIWYKDYQNKHKPAPDKIVDPKTGVVEIKVFEVKPPPGLKQ